MPETERSAQVCSSLEEENAYFLRYYVLFSPEDFSDKSEDDEIINQRPLFSSPRSSKPEPVQQVLSLGAKIIDFPDQNPVNRDHVQEKHLHGRRHQRSQEIKWRKGA